MRTSLIETKEIEHWIFKEHSDEDRLVFEAKLIVNKSLEKKVSDQKDTYQVIRLYGREKLKSKIKKVESSLFSDSKKTSFQRLIHSIFEK